MGAREREIGRKRGEHVCVCVCVRVRAYEWANVWQGGRESELNRGSETHTHMQRGREGERDEGDWTHFHNYFYDQLTD